MKPIGLNMETNDDCGNNEKKMMNDDVEQQPDCSDFSFQLKSDRFELSKSNGSPQQMKRIHRKSVKECKDKDRIRNDIREIRSLLPPFCSSNKKQTHHEMLQHTITFIRLLLAQNKDLATTIGGSKDFDYAKILQENEELRAQNKQFRSILERIGMPENVDPCLMEATWRVHGKPSAAEDCVFNSCSDSVLKDERVSDGDPEDDPTSAHGNHRIDGSSVSADHGAEKKETAEVFETKTPGAHQDGFESTCTGNETVEDPVVEPSSCNLEADLSAEVPSSSMVVSSTNGHSVFMSPDSGVDRQAEMEKSITQMPPIHSNGNLSDISEPTSDAEGSDQPPLLTAVRRLALENALLQTSSMSVESPRTSENDSTRSLGLLHGNVADDMNQRYLQMMHQASFSSHVSTSAEPIMGINSTSSRFCAATTSPISPGVSESAASLGSSNQMNSVMMLPSGQLLLVSPHQNAGSNMIHGSESGMGSVMPSAATSTLAVHPARQETMPRPQPTGLYAPNFSINQGLTLGNQGVNGISTVSANNTVFMNPPIQYGVLPQQMTFFSGGQPGNILGPIIQPSCPPVNHLAVAQNPTVAVNMPQGQVALNTLPPAAPQNQHPSALILPNGQIVPVVTQPNLLFPQQQCTPVTGGLLMPSVQTPNLNIIGNVQNPPSQLRLGSNLGPAGTIQQTQVIANIRAPTYGLIQNSGQGHQPQYQIMGNSLQPIGNINGGGILLGQPQQKNMTTSLPGLGLPQAPGQFTVLSGNCIGAPLPQHPNNSGLYGGSCSTTVSTAVPLLQSKPNVFGSTASLPNIPTTLTAMLTPEGSIILAIPGCRDGELVSTSGAVGNKTQKATQRPLMPKPASKLEVVNQIALNGSSLPGVKTCSSVVPCEFGSPGTTVTMTSSPMVPLTVNTTTNMDFCCVLSGPASTASSTDILAKATKSIFSVSPYENLSPRSLFNPGINDGLLTFSSSGIPSKNDPSAEAKSSAALKLKRPRPKSKPKSIKKKTPKSGVVVAPTIDPELCFQAVQQHETIVDLSPDREAVDQLQNDDEVSDINDFSDLIRIDPMTPISPKVAEEPEVPSVEEKSFIVESTEVADPSVSLTDDRKNGDPGERNAVEELIEIDGVDQTPDIVVSDDEEKAPKLEDSVPCTVSSTAGPDNPTINSMALWTSSSEVSAAVSSVEPSSHIRVEATSCREVGTSTERKRKRHKRQRLKVDHETREKRHEINLDDKTSSGKSSADIRNQENRNSQPNVLKINDKKEVIVSLSDEMLRSDDAFETTNLFSSYLSKIREDFAPSKEEKAPILSFKSHSSHSKLGLGKKQHKRSHRSFLKVEMLPDTLTFTESELLDVVDKVENMMMTDDRETKKRSRDRIAEEPRSRCDRENTCKKSKCSKDEGNAPGVSRVSPVEPVKHLPWSDIPTSDLASPCSNQKPVTHTLPGFEMEEDMVRSGGTETEELASNGLNPQGPEKDHSSVETPVFLPEPVVPWSPKTVSMQEPENSSQESSKSGVNTEVASSEIDSQTCVNIEPQKSTDSHTDDVAVSLLFNEPVVSTTGGASAVQARHSGIASLAKQVAPSKPHGSFGAGVQPKVIASKSMNRVSQGATKTESEGVATSRNPAQPACLDMYNGSIFSNKEPYLTSSKELSLDFSLDLEAKDKTPSPTDVTAEYDWVIGDPEPPALASLSFSPLNESEGQLSFDTLNDSKAAYSKTTISSSDSLLIETSVQSSVAVTQIVSSCQNESSCSSNYRVASPVEHRKPPVNSTAAVKQCVPVSSNYQIASTFGAVTTGTVSNHTRTSVAPASGKASSCTLPALNCSAVQNSSNYPTRSLANSTHSSASGTSSSMACSSSLTSKVSSISTCVTCTTTTVKTTVASSSSNSRSSCSQKSLESSVRPIDGTTSMYRSAPGAERTERQSCSKDGSLRAGPDYFGSSLQVPTSSSCAVQGKSLEDAFHYPLPPYLLNSSRDCSQVDGCLSRYSSGGYGMLSGSSCAGDYNALARYYFSTPFAHDLSLEMASHQRMSPNQNLPSCSIEKHSSTSKVGSANSNRLDGGGSSGAKSCQARRQDDVFSGFTRSSHMATQDVAHCGGNSQFLEPRSAAHGLVAHNHDSSSSSRANQRLGSGMQNNSSRSRSSTRSPASASVERLSTYPLHGVYSGTSTASSLASPPLHHHSVASDRHCLSQQLGYDLMFHNPAIQTFSPNLNGVGFDPPPLNFSRDCVNSTSPHTQSKKTGKKVDDHSSKMVLSHTKQPQSATLQSEQPSKSGSGRSSRSSKKTGKTNYEADSGMYENRSITPYIGLGNMSPNFPPDSLAYMNFFGNTGHPLSNAAKTLQHRDPPAPISHPFNSSLFSSSRAQNGLGLNFQTGFGMDHMNPSHITSSQMIIPHSSAISAHMHGFGFFPDISGSMVQRDTMPSMKFGRGPILPSQGTAEPGPLQHPQTVSNAMYNSRSQLPLHDMGFNALLSHQHAAFDARNIGGGMVHPPFGSHNHGPPSFGVGHLNFPVHNL